ncbi:MAG: M15 family peptidase [Candidatus Asgardarchaeum californiense]|nr:MAG: M15 family peptidase [Candidatus Asgardarchaeum californiense]
MSTLRKRQSKFVRLVILLLMHIHARGYEITFGDAYRDPRCKYGAPNSLHLMRLAIDLNLFKDGVYLTDTEDHREFGEYWESLDPDCSWGGHFNDGNHYSLAYMGRK